MHHGASGRANRDKPTSDGGIYPIKITKPSKMVPKQLPVMQAGVRAMSLYHGAAGIARMCGYPVPVLPEKWRSKAQSSVERLKQESSVEAFNVVHEQAMADGKKEQTVRGAAMRELQDFLAEYDKSRRYAGLGRIGDKDGAYAACDVIVERPKISTGKRIDAVMLKIRVALFFDDVGNAKKQLEDARRLAADGGDWDRNNRLSAYESAYLIVTRDVKGAAKKLLGGVATFTCVELCTYPEFVFYAVVTNVLALPRPDLKKRIIDSPEVLQVIKQIPHLSTLVESLYNCEYSVYFASLLEIEKVLLDDRYFSQHTRYVIRELRVLVYTQFLDAYKTVTLSSMAAAFGVSVEFIDGELARFISCGRLNAKVDKVDNVVHTTRADLKSKKYQEIIKSGDVLLNRIQQLARVVSI